ncbi:MAG: DNA (cytosine-5-)-methyltransferase [Gemmatimonadales bacterium]|nr:DNA (cytosine-5-)-methyltransferase [Gemmatimonadales bacterium]
MKVPPTCRNVILMSPQTKPDNRSGSDLRRLRDSLGMTQEQLAEACGWKPRTIARWEAGEGQIREAVFQYLLGLIPEAPAKGQFSFIDLFAGIGGFRLAFQEAGGRCVFTSEWDKYAQKTYRANFGDHEVHGDITVIPEADIPDHDILLAGFPCQPFSIAGVSKKNALGRKHGFDCETQGTLFFDIERIIAAKQPKAFVLENVKNLASHDKGRTFEVIRRTLAEKLGYEIAWKIIDAKRFVPQHRERIFIVGLHPDLGARFDWDEVDLPPVEKGPKLKDILHPEDGSETVDDRFLDPAGAVLPRYTLTPGLWEYLQGYAKKHKAAGNGFGFGLVGPDDVARTLSARYFKDGSEILIRRDGDRPRRLTPRECARLMGFDRPGREPFRIHVSDTQAYKQFGNSVAVPVVAAVAKALVPYVRGERRGAGFQQELPSEAA